MSMERPQRYDFGPFTADVGVRALLRDGQVIPLPPKAFDVLLVLLENGGAPVSRDDLMKTVWGDTFVEEGNLTHAVWVLRKTLGDDTEAPAYIVTIPRRGYKFVLPVRRRGPLSAPELEIEECRTDKLVIEEITDAEPRRKWGSWPAWPAALLTGLTAAGLLFWFTTAIQEPIKSIAILPLQYRGDRQKSYLADAISEELAGRLARTPGLKVTSPLASLRYKDAPQDAKLIGNTLGVEAVLAGAVELSGDRVRVSAQLIRSGDGVILWVEDDFETRMSNLFDAQERLARRIAAGLRRRLAEKDRPKAGLLPVSAEGHDLFLRGRAHLNAAVQQRSGLDAEIAHELLGRAERQDTNYAVARGWYAAALIHRYIYDRRRDSWLLDAVREARRALELDPELIVARRTLMLAYRNQGQTEAALEQAKYMLQTDSNEPLALAAAGDPYFRGSLMDRAISLYERAVAADPTDVESRYRLARCYMHGSQWAAGASITDALVREGQRPAGIGFLFPLYLETGQRANALRLAGLLKDHFNIAEAPTVAAFYRVIQRPDLARAASRRAVQLCQAELDGGDNLLSRTFLARAYADLNERDLAREQIAKVTSVAPDNGWATFQIALAYASLGEKNSALACSRRLSRSDISNCTTSTSTRGASIHWKASAVIPTSFASETRSRRGSRCCGQSTDLTRRSFSTHPLFECGSRIIRSASGFGEIRATSESDAEKSKRERT